jgi:CelD/BcsL family acetyltransferase involved in cellulose biosynthesis
VQIRSIPWNRLTEQQWAAWRQLQAADATLDSPFFHPAFSQAVAAVRDDVEVGVVEDDGSPIGFLPFHRQPGNAARPVGLHLSDFQGVIHRDGQFDAARVIAGCGLRVLHFNHLLDSQAPFAAHHWRSEPSPWMDVSGGFDHYLTTRANPRCDQIKQVGRHVRKIDRELGPIRVEPFCTDRAVLQRLIDWKIEQYRKLNSVNHLSHEWVRTLLTDLIERCDDELRGMLSVLYISERVAAIHLGIRSRHVLHSWIPAYDPALSKYSPGGVLLIELARMAETLGIGRIDLGRGPEPYKQRFMSGVTMVNEGAVDLRPLASRFHRGVRCTRELVRSSSLRAPAQYLVRSGRAWLVARQWQRNERGTARTSDPLA